MKREKVKREDVLTPKQRRFVNEYVIDLNATQAAKRAGYSEKTCKEQGTRLLSYAAISEAINARQAERQAASAITAEFVLTGIRQVHDMAVAAGNLHAANKSLELLGRHLAMFVDRTEAKVEQTNTDRPAIELEADIAARLGIKPEELRARLGEH